ncbi:hypothetical protein [Pseudomonas putida]|uniref:Uncharacterized protein n=1 Tax=Pseudomonas putida TaxID=303 RepID=A0A6I6XPN6_PSEPU|nr:hypothetical protein [Pseudomonas putida]QHG67831.1 hypothetical protein C2H86_26875 [Pseudomonas putida]
MTVTIEEVSAVNEITNLEEVFRVECTVTVSSPAIELELVEPVVRNKGGWAELHLQTRDTGEITLQVETKKTVVYEQKGTCKWPTLRIVSANETKLVNIDTIKTNQ